MRTRTMGALLATVACGAALTIASCDSGSTDPVSDAKATPGGSKSPHVLTTCASVFTGIEHCTIGGTNLTTDAAAGEVAITGFSTNGHDGVSSSFSDATEWSQRALTNFGTGIGGTVHLAAISDGRAVSELHIERTSVTTTNFTPTFTAGDGGGSRFHVHVYNNGLLLGGQESLDPNTTIPIVAIYGSGDDDRNGGDRPRRKFHTARSMPNNPTWQLPGACEWSQTSRKPGAKFTVKLPNGTNLEGDEVLFTEEVAAGQAVYSNFQRIDVTGNMESYTILGETVVPTE